MKNDPRSYDRNFYNWKTVDCTSLGKLFSSFFLLFKVLLGQNRVMHVYTVQFISPHLPLVVME